MTRHYAGGRRWALGRWSPWSQTCRRESVEPIQSALWVSRCGFDVALVRRSAGQAELGTFSGVVIGQANNANLQGLSLMLEVHDGECIWMFFASLSWIVEFEGWNQVL